MSPSTTALDLVELDAAHRGDVADAGGQAGGEPLQQELDRGRAVVGADQHRRVVGVGDERRLVAHLAAGAVEVVDGDAAEWVPEIHFERARNLNSASSGAPPTALMVASSTGVFTPLSAGFSAWAMGLVMVGFPLVGFVVFRVAGPAGSNWSKKSAASTRGRRSRHHPRQDCCVLDECCCREVDAGASELSFATSISIEVVVPTPPLAPELAGFGSGKIEGGHGRSFGQS